MIKTTIPIILIVLSSCSASKVAYEQKDSTITTIETRHRDSLLNVSVPQESKIYRGKINKLVTLNTSIYEASVRPTENEEYEFELKAKDEARITTVIQIPEQTITTVTESIRKETIIKEVEKKIWWKTTLIWIGSISILLKALKVVWKLYGGGIPSTLKISGMLAKLFS